MDGGVLYFVSYHFRAGDREGYANGTVLGAVVTGIEHVRAMEDFIEKQTGSDVVLIQNFIPLTKAENGEKTQEVKNG